MNGTKKLSVGIVGAGPAGLCAIKNSLSFGCDVTAFEQTDQIGGLWVYTDNTDKDKNGLDVHSSLYQGLRTNDPKETLSFPDFPIKGHDEKSFLPSEEVLKYIESYAEAFNLRKYVSLEHHVLRIRPLANDQWEFIVNNFKKNKLETHTFDIALVCNGKSVPYTPKMSGQHLFTGRVMHAHFYRHPRSFVGEKVCIIGGGPSGWDLTYDIGKVAKKLYWSHHMTETFSRNFNWTLPKSVVEKPDILKLTETGAEFVDGSVEEFSTLVYATGFDIKYPFLSADCGLTCDDRYIHPLYKHCININQPSMAIIGLPIFINGNPVFDLMVRFFFTFMTGRKQLPSKEEMLEDTKREMDERFSKMPTYKAHVFGPERVGQFYDDLARIAGIEGLKPVIAKMFVQDCVHIFEDCATYRDYKFDIVDDENFNVRKLNGKNI